MLTPLRRALICGMAFLGWASIARAGSVQPSPPSATFTNSVNFDFTHDVFSFSYQGSDGTLTYQYAPAGNGSFYPLTCVVNGSYTFRPSNFGGLSLQTSTTEIFPWSAGVTFTLLSPQANGNSLSTQWLMKSGTNRLTYNLQFQMVGRTLIIGATAVSGTSGGLYLDRCENATNPVVVCVPYLTLMNVLYTGGVFGSMFFDWENTSASTIYPLDSVFSTTSVYYAHQALYLPRTDGTRASVNETIYLTVSPSLADVLPNVPNPPSPYKKLVSNYLVFDNWEAPFATVNSQVQSLRSASVSNLWVLVHNWQNGGYDNQYPNVLPANPGFGGSAGLTNVSQTARAGGYLFGLHENYVDFYPNAAAWNPAACALNSDGSLKQAWSNSSTHVQSYEMKPTLAANYLTNFAPQIHSNYTTTASFLDVHSAVNPSDKVDYDAATTNAGTFYQTLSRYRTLYSLLRAAHQGPVSGEGNYHLLSVGYIDDVEAQIDSGGSAPAAHGSWLPLIVDFELLKLHDKTLTHGVGYYERFFSDQNNSPQYLTFPFPAVLEYLATELAYGHGGFIPTPGRVYDYVATAQLEQRHILAAQALYANATPVNILYHDSISNDEVSVSDYIRRYPTNFANSSEDHYLSQVRVTYNNGVVVCVNRHPSRQWQVQLGQPGGFFNYNAVMNGTNVQWVGRTNLTSYLLPQTNGWVVFAPAIPKISAITVTNGTVNLAITNLLPGFSNQIQRSLSFPVANWDPVDTFVSNSSQTNWLQPLTDAWPQAFYRLVQFW
ncbi:exported hypothetical protein [Verrucomicrobia bacterium]|nr:exported hypothetical protein [Verrucomicrobiota bacterium]